jgi:hypothetical protein
LDVGGDQRSLDFGQMFAGHETISRG